MSWQEELDELRARELMAREMGGTDKVRRQHDGGRLTVRERIEALVDADSFHEIGAIAGKGEYDPDGRLRRLTPSNCVMGRARMEGRPVVVVGDDFTVRGGSADATIPTKPILAERMAGQLRLPIVRIIEGSGGGGSVKTIETSGRANLPGGLGQSTIGFQLLAETLATVPVVALGLGSVAGLGAARLAASHYSVMTKTTSAMFVAGPPVVARVGQQLDKQTLGGWEVQCRAGAVDHAVDSEEEAFRCARRFLSYLPASVYGVSERGDALIRPTVVRTCCSAWSRATGARVTACVRSSRQLSIETHCSRSAACSGARSSRRWHALTDCRSRCWPAIPITTGGPGRRRRARKSSGLWTWPRPFICRSCIWPTVRAF